MNEVTLVADCPDEDTSAQFRSEILKWASLYGVTVKELRVGDKPSLTLLRGGGDEAA